MTYPGDTTRSSNRFWVSLGSPKAVRIVYVIVLVYAIIIGGLMLGYTRVQSCLADYSDASAAALKVRAQTSTDDRIVNQRVEAVDQSDRSRIIANQQALAALVQAATNNNGELTRTALLNFQKSNEVSLDLFARNEKERTFIAEERARIDRVRAATPLPDAPSELC